MIAPDRQVSIARQAERIDISRGTAYSVSRTTTSDADQALYRKPNTSRKHPQRKVYPDLLRKLAIARANHVWAMDMTDIPMARGWVSLAAVVDWASRRVLAHRVSIAMDTAFCIEALEDVFAKHGRPEIFNTDQGSQFASAACIEAPNSRGVAISMDGRGGWRDNAFVERRWRTIKYEHVYRRA